MIIPLIKYLCNLNENAQDSNDSNKYFFFKR